MPAVNGEEGQRVAGTSVRKRPQFGEPAAPGKVDDLFTAEFIRGLGVNRLTYGKRDAQVRRPDVDDLTALAD
jgi:hypothetical protein